MSKQGTQRHADDLVELLTAMQAGKDVFATATVDPQDQAMVKGLVEVAESIRPSVDFVTTINSMLRSAENSAQARPVTKINWNPFSFLSRSKSQKQSRLATHSVLAIGLGLFVSALIVIPVLAQFALAHYAPQQVEVPLINATVVSIVTMPSEAYSSELDLLESQAGFDLLLPSFVPSNCVFTKGVYLPAPIEEVDLFYDTLDGRPCFDVAQQRIKPNMVHEPYVGSGATEEITINGQPALYIHGMWWVDGMDQLSDDGKQVHVSESELDELFETAIWMDGPQQIAFELDGKLIRVNADVYLSKDALIDVAESLE